MSIQFGHGYRPGILGWCVAEHAQYYAGEWDFGAYFEAKVASGMADFIGRLDRPDCHLFWAADAEGLLATLSLDGGDREQGLTHLRWFIASDRARGQGVGLRLIETAIDTARTDGFDGIFLTTFAGLDAARRLYDKTGFVLDHESENTTWGPKMLEQRFVLRF